MEKIIKRKKLDKNTVLDYKRDDGDYACRIWEQWRPRMTKFPCFGLALRLVVLCQLSSCSVEHILSGLNLIQHICGGRFLEDHLEMRLFLKCNGDLYEFMAAIQRYIEGY